MLVTISAEEIGLDGEALAVRYRRDAGQPDLLVVSIVAHKTEGDHVLAQRSELRLLVIKERMSHEAMQVRVRIEAARRAIARMAWIEER